MGLLDNMKLVRKMKAIAQQLGRGHLTLHEAEHAMNEAILDGVLEMPSETAEQNDKRIAAVRTLKRRMWRILLDATK